MSSQFDIEWGDVTSPKGNGNNVDFMTLESGKAGNIVRVVSKPSKLDLHWEEDAEGKTKRIICSGSKCLLCEHGSKITPRYQILVLDKNNWSPDEGYKDGAPKVKVLEIGRSVINQIKDIATDPEYGNIEEYNLRIRKEGSGYDTKYSVVASPQRSELTAEEKEAVKNAPKIRDLNKVLSAEEILDLHLNILQSSASNDSPSESEKSDSDEGWDNF